MGRTPKASKATKRGIKGRKISKEISSFPMLSSQPMEIGYKKKQDETRIFHFDSCPFLCYFGLKKASSI
jgi:hypothetical protein